MESKKPSRRKFLKGGAEAAMAGLAVGAIGSASAQTIAPDAHPQKPLKDLVAYGERSRFVTSVRVPVAERESPDQFGLTFHVLSPLQDSVGIITPSSLHFVGTHRGAIVPDIDPKEHRLLIHGMVDRPLEFTMEELRRFPSVSRIHFLECLGNRSQARIQDRSGNARIDQLQRMDRSAAVSVAQRSRRAKRGFLGSFGGIGGGQRSGEHSAGEGHGRLYRGLRPEWRGRCVLSKAFPFGCWFPALREFTTRSGCGGSRWWTGIT